MADTTDPARPPAAPAAPADSGAPAPQTLTVRRLAEADWESYRELRLEMLADSPDYFWATLDEVADATRAISDAFDSGDVMGEQPYTLEVSSAGVDRPLTTPEQYRRNVGRLLKITLADGSTTTDRLTGAGPDHLTLAGRPDSPVPLDEVTRALVQVEFSRPDGKDD